MRLFVAVDLSDEAKDAIAREQHRIVSAISASKPSLRLVKPGQMHLTLLFLGEIHESRVPSIVESMSVPSAVRRFDATLKGIGVFPPHGAPRVLWLGVGPGAEPLTMLQSEIAARARALGVAFDDRPFHAHLTLGRWRESRSADRVRALETARREPIARIHVDGATLYRSRLSPAGPAYSALARVTLSKNESGRGDIGTGD